MPRISFAAGTPSIVTGATARKPRAIGYLMPISVPFVSMNPIQVVGLVPFTACNIEECREDIYNDSCCEILPVFGQTSVLTATYENDFSTFLFDCSLWQKNTSGYSINFVLQEYDGTNWNDVVTLSNTYGTLYGFNSLPFSHYKGIALNWGRVLLYHGEGVYRMKVNATLTTYTLIPGEGEVPTAITVGCLVSEAFCLKTFDCEIAHSTVKFENWLTGQVGDIYTDGLLHNLCGFLWYDSIRFKGKISEIDPTYTKVTHKYQTGLMREIRNEIIQKYELETGLLPKWLVDRFKVYGLFGDKIFGSDYNINNSDWDIKRKNFYHEEGFKQQAFDISWRRKLKFTTELQRGVQNIIKTLCCT